MRSKVEIVQIRACDAQSGDVVNKRGPDAKGWVEVAKFEELENGNYVIHDETDKESFTANGYDLIWLQVVKELSHNSHLPVPD